MCSHRVSDHRWEVSVAFESECLGRAGILQDGRQTQLHSLRLHAISSFRRLLSNSARGGLPNMLYRVPFLPH
jgi:hypothetical protein